MLHTNGHDWADRFPAIVDAALRIKASSFLIDGEAVVASDDGMSDFRALWSKYRGMTRCCSPSNGARRLRSARPTADRAQATAREIDRQGQARHPVR